MFGVSLRRLPRRIVMSSCVLLSLLALSLVFALTASAQKADDPLFLEFKGVRIGMLTEDARKKLGNPKDKGDEQDFYLINDNQAVQVYYDKATKKVTAISIDFMNGANEIPTAKQIIGSEIDAKADGSGYKMVRYPKAGYWVSYSRTAGKEPTITITMQKIE
jgi:ABC-type microcin C transport system permease subunit YejE